jgi:hypothetical protein
VIAAELGGHHAAQAAALPVGELTFVLKNVKQVRSTRFRGLQARSLGRHPAPTPRNGRSGTTNAVTAHRWVRSLNWGQGA